jgi:hypothetical protein
MVSSVIVSASAVFAAAGASTKLGGTAAMLNNVCVINATLAYIANFFKASLPFFHSQLYIVAQRSVSNTILKQG